MRSIAWMFVATALPMVGCVTAGQNRVAFSSSTGSSSFEIFASAPEATSAARLVVERLGLVILSEDSEELVVLVGSSDRTPLFKVSVVPNDRQVRVVTSYEREARGTGIGDREIESLSRKIREISDAIRTELENLPPDTPSGPGMRLPSSVYALPGSHTS